MINAVVARCKDEHKQLIDYEKVNINNRKFF